MSGDLKYLTDLAQRCGPAPHRPTHAPLQQHLIRTVCAAAGLLDGRQRCAHPCKRHILVEQHVPEVAQRHQRLSVGAGQHPEGRARP